MKKRWISLLLALAVTLVFIPTIYAGAAETTGVPLTITSGNISSENNLRVSVNVGQNSEASMIEFCIVFDAEKLNIESCSAGSVMKDIGETSPVINYNSEPNPNKIYFVWEAIDPITSEGSLLDIAFSLKDSAAIGDELDISFAEDEDFTLAKIISDGHEDIDVLKTNGKIKVVDSHAVSGTLTSWNNTDDTKIMIYPADTADSDIKTDIKRSAPLLGTPATKGAVTANADGKRFDQTYSFSAVAEGSYKLAAYKSGGYAVSITEITVGSSDLTQDVPLGLLGDANGDGNVTASDMQRIYSHLNNSNPLGSELAKGDANGDGLVTASDMQRIYAHLNGSNPLF